MRLLVLALDGFPFHLLREIGLRLPNISKLLEEGSWGRLESTVPYVTSTAWSTFITGTNPGRHGVVGFFSRSEDNPTELGRLVAGASIKGTSLWRRLSDGNITVGVLGVPMTYRPERVNGFIVSGFPIPRDAKDYTEPLSLRDELEGMGWNFADIPTQSYSKDKLEQFYAELKLRVKQKTDAVLYLLRKYDRDFFMVHYFETDKLLHEYLNFRYPDKCERKDYERFHSYVDDFMLFLDSELGRIFSLLPPSCNVLVVSDHGLAAGNHLFMADTWLLKKHYLRVKGSLASRLRYLLFRLGLTPEFAFRAAPKRLAGSLLKGFMDEYWTLGPAKRQSKPLMTRLLYSLLMDKRRDVDWEESVAYSFGGYGVASIYVKEGMPREKASNLRVRIFAELASLKHEGRVVFDEVHYDSDVYVMTRETRDIPDIMAYDEETEYVAMSNPVFFTSNKVITRKYANENEANHDRSGIFVAWGPEMAHRGLSGDRDIADIHPTILHLFGLGIGKDVDGKVALELFNTASDAAKRRPEFVEPSGKGKDEQVFSETEEEEIAGKLREMGYI